MPSSVVLTTRRFGETFCASGFERSVCRIDEIERAIPVVLSQELQEVVNVFRQVSAFCAYRLPFPYVGIVRIRRERVIVSIRQTSKGSARYLPQDGLMEFSLDAKPIPVVVVLPLPRAPHSILINEGQDILQIRTMMQVIKLGYAICVVARQRMRRNVVDLVVSDPDDTTVVKKSK